MCENGNGLQTKHKNLFWSVTFLKLCQKKSFPTRLLISRPMQYDGVKNIKYNANMTIRMEISGLTELAYLWSPHIHSRSSRTVVSVLDVFFNTDDISKSVTIIFLGGPRFWYLNILGSGRMIFLGGLNIFRRASRVKRCKISSTGNWVGNIKLKPDYHNFPHKDNDQILQDFSIFLIDRNFVYFIGTSAILAPT